MAFLVSVLDLPRRKVLTVVAGIIQKWLAECPGLYR
jgi:hypothetical protein